MTVVSTASTQSLMSSWLSSLPPTGMTVQQSSPLAFGGPAALWGLLGVLAWLGTTVLSIGAVRSFVNRETETVSRSYFRRNLPMALLNVIVGGIVFAVAVGIGLIFLVVPGIFLAVSLIFWQIYVVEEDQNFVEAFKNSWDLTSGSRIDLFLLGLGVVIAGIVIGFIFGIPSLLLNLVSPGLGALVSNIGNAFETIFGLAALVNAYNQLQ